MSGLLENLNFLNIFRTGQINVEQNPFTMERAPAQAERPESSRNSGLLSAQSFETVRNVSHYNKNPLLNSKGQLNTSSL